MIENEIGNHFIGVMTGSAPPSSVPDYAVGASNFAEIAARLQAKVERGADNSVYLTLYTTAGETRVYADNNASAGFTVIARRSRPEPPSLIDRVGEQILEHALETLRVRQYHEAATLVGAFVNLRDSVIRESFGAPQPAGLASGAACRASDSNDPFRAEPEGLGGKH